MPRIDELGKSFSGDISDVAMDHPFPQPSPPRVPGFPLGPLLGSRETFTFDPLRLTRAGVLSVPIVRIFGNMGGGKSTFMKLMLYWHYMQDMGGRRSTLSYDNHRYPGGVAEVEGLNRLIGVKSIPLSKQQLNILHWYYGMQLWEQVVLVSSLLADQDGIPLTRHMPFILESCLHSMRSKDLEKSSVMRLANHVINHEISDLEEYFSATRQRAHQLESLPPSLSQTTPELRHIRKQSHEYSEDAALLFERLVRLTSGDGPMGSVFGDKHYIPISKEGHLSLDYFGLTDIQKGGVIGFVQQIRNSHKRRGERRFSFDAIADDEGYDLMQFLTYAMAQVFDVKRVRDEYDIRYRSTQSPADYSITGNVDSQIRSIAEASMSGGGMNVVYQLDESGIDAYHQRWPINGLERKMLARQPVGCAGFHFPGERMFFVQTLLTPLDRRFTNTTGALTAKTGDSPRAKRGVFA